MYVSKVSVPIDYLIWHMVQRLLCQYVSIQQIKNSIRSLAAAKVCELTPPL